MADRTDTGAGRFDYTPVMRGDTVSAIEMEITNSDTGLPLDDLTSYQINQNFRLDSFRSEVLFTKSIGNGITITDGPGAVIQLDAWAVDPDIDLFRTSESIKLVHDIEFISPAGKIGTWVFGEMIVWADITR